MTHELCCPELEDSGSNSYLLKAHPGWCGPSGRCGVMTTIQTRCPLPATALLEAGADRVPLCEVHLFLHREDGQDLRVHIEETK